MGTRAEQWLTKAAQEKIEKSYGWATLKTVMSAGVLALSELDVEKQVEYMKRATGDEVTPPKESPKEPRKTRK